MTDEREDEPETVRCPKCKAKVRLDDEAKKTHVAKCPNGHEVELVKMIE